MNVLHIPGGFLFSAARAGIKASGGLDLALAEAPLGASAAAVFTRNRVVAAPITVGKRHLRKTRGRVRALVVNAGNANCATGAAGYRAAIAICAQAAKLLGAAQEFVFVSSTGIIGVPMPVESIVKALPKLVGERQSGKPAVVEFTRAIMTTDTRPKLASQRVRVAGRTASILGVAKGSGMIEPNLATMLVYLFTDVNATPALLRSVLGPACNDTFNHISVDGDSSTNDTVLLLASGASGWRIDGGKDKQSFSAAIHEVCESLAEQIVADGEGVQHVVRLTVEGARSDRAADKIARTIAHSLLVKTAFAGADPNWGRILAAAGRSGVPLKISEVDVHIGPHHVCHRGAALPFDEAAAHTYMRQPKYEVGVRVGRGEGSTRLLTCDLTAEYVHINADYST